ncbi:39S ribosomal protein L55, mitochondrial [Diorhabda carinulata]|uniref:39S ribosomal protein L55, mitochondrial n=1 Tax=Diorhabda sublineata TaxID=1163346 RepID=UPI0024E10DA0|nr:39S ribosomal protein L55, mitochondrial [Diorhabda sublineata]XP_057656812.1 39S ribosomal protein L55, mitochondrial [Diorhabda carinulata]
MIILKNLLHIRQLSSASACITKPHRSTYVRTYPTVLANPDGSTFTIHYEEPRKLIKLPINIWTLSESERKAKLEERKPKKKVKIVDDIEDSYDSKKYLKYIKK